MFCELRDCRSRAKWVVGVGSRQTDRTRTCEKHLAMTCRAMYEAEGRNAAALILQSMKQFEREEMT